MTVWAHIEYALLSPELCVLVSVTKAVGSTPRETDAHMVVTTKGSHGTIGGGELELRAIDFSNSLIEAGTEAMLARDFSLGPDLGQCCGGRVELRFEVFTPERLAEVSKLAHCESEGRFQTNGILGSTSIRRTRITPQETALPSCNAVLEAFGVDPTRLAIFGSGHVAKALMLSLAPLPFSVTLIDNRLDAFPSVTPRHFTCVHTDDPPSIVSDLSTNSQILIMTHSHQIDLQIVSAALGQNRFNYIGLIGSKTKKKRFHSQLRTLGFDDEDFQRLTCPIGIDTIRSKEPSSIAISVIAELLAEREKLHAERAHHHV